MIRFFKNLIIFFTTIGESRRIKYALIQHWPEGIKVSKLLEPIRSII